MEVATAGGAAALTTLKVADKTVDAERLINRQEYVVDAERALEKIENGAKLGDVPEKLVYVVNNANPSGTFRDTNGKLRNKDGAFAKETNTVKFFRGTSESKKALIHHVLDTNSGLSDSVRKQIIDSKSNNVPIGYEVDHEIPLYTKKLSRVKNHSIMLTI